ncbi:uncharacterized protein F5Z01DRAFT_673825 [Emericellopsis atlantica]|uniref:Uncharacterized protein n=1 Tax=Emericellopsis atlantica TaxID=2614577 RepID=A0A9P7ZM59_9HYPO|nr:uncharacterized protein F5Z01DRAFT_673825 [Emericellopsis atlantica]KAG9254678.1 hypothetical protein F5Z01DRAFT_673825 [Emericellopsis atlantica]
MAEHWNVCIQICEDEKNQAVEHIGKLEEILMQRDESLLEAHAALVNQESLSRGLKDQLEELQVKRNESSKQEQAMSAEIRKLREQLSASQVRTAELGEKYKICKTKINEAIKEQQDLYTRSNEHCKRLKIELERAELERNEKTAAVDEALQLSRQKREEMRILVQQRLAELEKEAHLKGCQIAHLREELDEQRKLFQQEKQNAAYLQNQFDAAEHRERDVRQTMATQLARLADAFCNADLDKVSKGWDKIVDLINDTTSALITAVKDIPNQEALELLFNSTEDKMTYRLESALKRNITDRGLPEKWGQQIAEVLDACLHEQLSAFGQVDAVERMEESLGRIETATAGSEQGFKDIINKLDQNKCDELETLKHEHLSREHEQHEAFVARYEKLNSRERELQILIEDYSAKIARAAAADASGRTAETVAIEFGKAVDVALEKERRWTTQMYNKGTSALETIRARIDGLADNAQQSWDKAGVLEQLSEERGRVMRLTTSIARLEKEASEAGPLKDKWAKDIHHVDALRAHLRSLANTRVPRVEEAAAKLGAVARMNQIIASTSSYLSTEKTWIVSQLAALKGNASQAAPAPAEGHGHPRGNDAEPKEMCSVKAEQTLPVPGPEKQSADDLDVEKFAKQVRVNTPVLLTQPSCAPAVEQEQRQRRQPVKPRSILRRTRSVQSGENDKRLDNNGVRANLNQTQYNRLVVAENPAIVSKAQIDMIRDGFLSAEQTGQGRDLPALKDFAQEQKSKHFGLPGKRSLSIEGHNIHDIGKRFRKGSQEVSPGDLASFPVHQQPPIAKDPKSRRLNVLGQCLQRNLAE